MAALIPSSLRTISTPTVNRGSWFTTVFPFDSKTACFSIVCVWVGYLLFAVYQARFVQYQSVEFFLAHYLMLTFVSAIATWLLYRMMFVLRSSDFLRSLILLYTLPSFILALLLAFADQWLGTKPLFFPELFYGMSVLIGATNLLIPYLLLVSWCSVFLALSQNEQMETTIRNSQKLQNITRQSEQRALRYQLNPHFIFNALNSVSSLVVDNKNEQAERLVDELADYMRVVLDDEGQEMVTVANEIAQQVRYLEIEKVRFPNRLCYEIEISEEAENLQIPALIIQPLVENAIKHGVAKSTGRVVIKIEAETEKGRLKISVSNTGKMSIDQNSQDTGGTGLLNIADRLTVSYGPTAALITGNNKNEMAVATIIIPTELSMSKMFVP